MRRLSMRRLSMRRWLILLLCLAALLGGTNAGRAAHLPQVSDSVVAYTFGGQVNFRAQVPLDLALESAQVFLRGQGESQAIVGDATLLPGELTYTHDLSSQPLRAFSTIEYWYRLQPAGAEAYNSETYTFVYEDNRFTWQTLDSPPFSVHWYDGEISFAQDVLNAAQKGLERAGKFIQLANQDRRIDIYVYASGKEMQSTLLLGGLDWIAGHADPELYTMVVTLPPGPSQKSEIDRQIPHELMHILMYQAIGPDYYGLPTWLKEGMASYNELRPNPEYYVILQNAVEKDSLVPLSYLCQRFPSDQTVYLAYAEANSFVSYLFQEYGPSGLQAIVKSYADGQGCEQAPLESTGLTLSELERDWRRATLGEDVLLAAFENLLPWLILIGLALLAPFIMTLANLATRRAAKIPAERVS